MATNARLDELKKKFDENPRRYFAPLANEYRKQGDASQAIALCRTHLPNQPGHISGHIVLAQALYETRELGESRQVFEAALDLDPENLIALRYLGDIAREQGSPAAAQAWYRRVLEFDPRNEEISQLLIDVGQEATVEIADLASRPTPPTASPVATEVPTIEVVEEVVEVDAAPTPEVAAEAEPIDLYDADPTGDAWRETMAERAESAAGMMELSDLDVSDDRELKDVGELAAVPETPVDDWFAPPASPTPAHVDAPSVEEFAPDLIPAPESSIADEAFSWSSAEPETVSGEQENNSEELVAENSPSEPLLDFSSWSDAVAASTEPSVASSSGDKPHASAWDPSLPSLRNLDAETAVPPVESTPEAGHSHPADPDEVPASTEAEDDIDLALDEHRDASESLVPSLDAGVIDAALTPTSAWDDARNALGDETLEPAHLEADSSADAVSGIDTMEPSPEQTASATADENLTSAEAFDPAGEVGAGSKVPQSSVVDEVEQHAGGSDPLIGRTPSFVPMVSEESAAPFVTETMAELYLQQGFHDEALSIYRQLLSRNPADMALADRVRALESGASSAVVPEDVSAPAPNPSSESARSFFARFANRTPADRAPGGNATESAVPAAPTLTVPMAGAAMPDEAMTRPDEPALTRIFSGQDIPAADARAASTLASAFGTGGDPALGARSGELSLERLFRDVPARSSGAVTLGDMGTQSSPQSTDASLAPAAAEGEAPADYEQFTAWLEGLKKK